MSKPESHSVRSTSWKPGWLESKLTQIRSDRRKVMPAVQSATLRAFWATISGSPRIRRMKVAPTSGRKMTRDSSGQSLIAGGASQDEQVPGDQGSDPDQHGEGVVIEIAALEPDRLTGDVEHARRNAVRAKPVDNVDVVSLPQAEA